MMTPAAPGPGPRLRRPDEDAPADITAAALAQRYSYVLPDARSLEILCCLGPLIEMGAGTGFWAHRLQARGADVIAFDQAPPDGEAANRYHHRAPTWTEVRPGDHTVLPAYPGRALFLCWPPLFSALGDCLSFYSGDTVACIGDGGYRTARLRDLDETFTQVAVRPVQALDPFPGIPATLSIWRRDP
jgi:hypothetical protein